MVLTKLFCNSCGCETDFEIKIVDMGKNKYNIGSICKKCKSVYLELVENYNKNDIEDIFKELEHLEENVVCV